MISDSGLHYSISTQVLNFLPPKSFKEKFFARLHPFDLPSIKKSPILPKTSLFYSGPGLLAMPAICILSKIGTLSRGSGGPEHSKRS